MNDLAQLVLTNPDETWTFTSDELLSVNFENSGMVIRFKPSGSCFYPLHRIVSYDFYPDEASRERGKVPSVELCVSCDEPAVDSGEGRYCDFCSDYEGTCVNDHCLTCGGRT